jgi:signal transduction histidine kinase/CheY-like chemotaxis protein
VDAVVEGADDIPWAATSRGLAWFDGHEWISTDHVHSGEGCVVRSLVALPDASVAAILDERLVLASRSGATEQELSLDGAALHVYSLAALPDGSLLVTGSREGGGGELLRITRGSPPVLARVAVPLLRSVSRVVALEGGDILVSGMGGLVRMRGDAFEPLLTINDLCVVEAAARLADGTLVLSFASPLTWRGVWEIREGEEPTRPPDGGADIARSVAAAEDGLVVTVHDSGRVRAREGRRWTSQDGLRHLLHGVQFAAWRRDGDLWFGTDHGLFLVRRSSTLWENWRHPDTTTHDTINGILVRADGSTWLATGAGLCVHEADGTWRTIDDLGGRPLGVVTGIAEDGAGRVWIGSGATFEGTWCFEHGAWHHVGAADGLPVGNVHVVRIDRRGRPWLLGLAPYNGVVSDDEPGVFMLDGDKWVRQLGDDGRPLPRCYDMKEAADGTLWFATYRGLARLHEGKWRWWRSSDGLPSNRVFAVEPARDGGAWFSCQAGGVGHVGTSGKAEFLDEADGLAHDAAWGMTTDDDGRLWVTTQGGLSVVVGKAITSFRTGDGLPIASTWPVVVAGRRLFVGTLGAGVVVLDLDALGRDAPRVDVAAPIVEGSNALARWRVLPAWGEPSPDRAWSRWRVDDGAWSGWTRDHEAMLRGLRPGAHELEVEGRGLLALGTTARATGAIKVPPPAWRQPSVLAVMGLLVLLASGLAAALVSRWRREDRERRAREIDSQRAQRLESLGLLAGGVAHDFNNLLVGVLGNVGLALDEVPRDSRTHARLEQVERAASQCAELARQMLDFSGRGRFVVKPRDPSQLVLDCVSVLEPTLPPGVELRREVDLSLPAIDVDATQMKRVISNLILNAVEASGGLGAVVVKTRGMEAARSIAGMAWEGELPQGPAVVIEVSDAGAGMDEATRQRVFDPFFTTKRTGRGLGLASALGIVRGHGGAIGVHSVPGAGTRFVVALPRSAGVVEASAPPQPASPPPIGAGRLVLVVDDEPVVRQFARVALESQGYRVLLAASGEQAIEMLANEAALAQIVLLDLSMPGMTGGAVLGHLRSHRPGTRVVLMSGYDEEEAMSELGTLRPDAFLHKPYPLQELLRCVRSF